MPNEAQRKTYNFIRAEIARLRGPKSYRELSLDRVSELTDAKDRALFHVSDAPVFIENSGEIVSGKTKDDAGLPDCPRYADRLLKWPVPPSCLRAGDLLPAIAADLLKEDSPHKLFLDINSHTPESFVSYLQTGIPLRRELPFPIAIVSRKMGNEANGMRSFFLLLDLFEVVTRFIVLVQIADCMRGSRKKELIDKNPGLKNLRNATLGTWVGLFWSLRQFPPDDPFLREIKVQDEIEDRGEIEWLKKTLQHFLDLRNDSDHGITQGEAHYKSAFEQNIGKMEELLHTVTRRFLNNYWLIKPISIVHGGGDNIYSAWVLMGGNPSFDKRYLRSQRPLTVGRVYYLNEKREVLDLDPYIIVEVCNKCDREELLLFDQLDWDKGKDVINYLGYESCPKQHKPSKEYVNRLPQALRAANQ